MPVSLELCGTKGTPAASSLPSTSSLNMSIKDLSITNPTNVRGKMKQFWEQYEPSPCSMMLCSAANDTLAGQTFPIFTYSKNNTFRKTKII